MGLYAHRLAELSAARERAGRRAPVRPSGPTDRRRPYAPPRRDSRAAPRRHDVRIGTVIPSTYVPPPPPPPDTYVEAKRKSAMQTQSLLFSRADGWTESKAKEWAKEHGYKSNKVDVTDQYIRLRQLDPKKFTVKRTVPFGKGIRAVVAREEPMPTKKKKSTRRPAAKRTAAKRKPAPRKHAVKPKSAPKRSAARKRSKKATVVAARRRPRMAREVGRVVAAKRRPARRVREVRAAAEARRRKPRVREVPVVAEAKRKPASYVMAKRRPAPKRHRAAKHKVQAWFGDSAGHSKAAKKGWKTRKGHKASKVTRKAAESRRRPKKHHRVRETMTVQARRRPKKHHRARETMTVQARRRPKKHHRARETMTVQARRRPKKHHLAREASSVVRSKARRSYVRAPSMRSIGRSALDMGLELGLGVAGYLLADGVDRFLATYDPANAAKAGPNKFTSDGTGMLGNSLNVASAPDWKRYASLVGLTLMPLGGSLFIENKTIRSSVEGIGLGAGIKLATTLWESLLMPLLVGKDTSAPALQKSWVARLYPAEVSAALNEKAGKAAVSSGGANSTAGTLSGGADRDAGPFALAGRFDHGRGGREWVRPNQWQMPDVPVYDPNAVVVDPDAVPVAVQPAWPAHFGERHRWGLRGVGDAVQDVAQTIAAQTGVHPAHAVNAAMHVAGEPHDITQALRRALPHIRREILAECARHVHPHVVRMHGHARHPREHAEWEGERAAEGFPPPAHDAPEHEWREWHGKRAAADLPAAPPPPEPPAAAPRTPEHLRTRSEWQPKSDRTITFERFATTQQALGIGGPGGPAASGYPGQPGLGCLGDAFADAAQSAAATIPDMPLENAVNVAAHAATEPFSCDRAIERAMPFVRRELTRACAENMTPYIRQLTGIPLPPEAAAPPPPPPGAPELPAPPAPPVIEFVPSPPPPSWTRSEAEWHDEERRNWDRTHGGHAVVAAATHAAEAAAAPHPDAQKPAVQAAVHAIADKAAQAASAAPPGTPPAEVHAAAHEAAKVEAAEHPAVAAHPAVKAAVAAAPPAAAHAVAAQAAPVAGVHGVGNPPRNLPVGPPKIGKSGPRVPQHESECGCLDDSPYLGFVGDEVEEDQLFTLS
jgi:chemotaxis protein histidine kinase CheA